VITQYGGLDRAPRGSFSANSPGKTVGNLLMSTQFSLAVRVGAQEAFEHSGPPRWGENIVWRRYVKGYRGIWSRRHRRVLASPLDMKSEFALSDCFIFAFSTTILRLSCTG